jgi:Tfp pilus assembly protein PilF
MKHVHSVCSVCASLLLATVLASGAARAEDSLRPEVGKPMLAAQELLKGHKYKEAMAKIREAEAIANRTPYENFIMDRMRASAAEGAGDMETATKSFEAVINANKLAPADQLNMMEALAGTYYRAKDYAHTITWLQRYLKEGGANPQMRTLLIQSQYLNGDYAGAASELTAEFAEDDRAGRASPEVRLQLLANCQLKLKDFSGYAGTLERLVSLYPKKEYWADLIARLQRKPGFSNRLALDVLRLQRATGNLKEAAGYMEYGQLALLAGLPAEAKRVVAEGFEKGILGKGNDAQRQARLRDLASRQADEDRNALGRNEKSTSQDGNALVNDGNAYVSHGDFKKGIALIEQGIAKGGLKQPEDARLHLGLAYLQADNKTKAVQVFKSVQGHDGSADLARLWVLHAR